MEDKQDRGILFVCVCMKGRSVSEWYLDGLMGGWCVWWGPEGEDVCVCVCVCVCVSLCVHGLFLA